MSEVLELRALDVQGRGSWRWELRDGDRTVLVEHAVVAPSSAWQFDAFDDLHYYLRWNASPDRRETHEVELIAAVGEWVTAHLLGPVAGVLAERAMPVVVLLPVGAAALGHLPWEVARVHGKTLVEHGVSFVVEQDGREHNGHGHGDGLRVLAVFSVPEDVGALNLRKERRELAAAIADQVATGRCIELRVVQYGVGRDRLRDVLHEEPGWDVVHLSGHALPAHLLLEDERGHRDVVSSAELVDLFDDRDQRLKLITVSACESAAVTARERLEQLGLVAAEPSGPAASKAAPAGRLPALAAALVHRLDCAVVAMRYPVSDTFAVEWARHFYSSVLRHGQTPARALTDSIAAVSARPAAGAPALSPFTPALFGRCAAVHRLEAPVGPAIAGAPPRDDRALPPAPERFVGRVGALTRASAALAPGSATSAVVFHGMAGGGKTACALELVHGLRDSFDATVWFRAPEESADTGATFSDLLNAVDRAVPGTPMTDFSTNGRARAGLVLAEFLSERRVLIVIDNAESLLDQDGSWRDGRWAELVRTLTTPDRRSRLVVTSRRRPRDLLDHVVVEPITGLSPEESLLLAGELPNLSALLNADPPFLAASRLSAAQARDLAAQVVRVVQGHPKLIELADAIALRPAALRERVDAAARAWLERGTGLEDFLRSGSTAADEDYFAVLHDWVAATVTALPRPTATLFRVLCCMEQENRLLEVVRIIWPHVWPQLSGATGEPPDPDIVLTPLADHALVDVVRLRGETQEVVRIHPGVADIGRTSSGDLIRAVVDGNMADLCTSILIQALREEREGELSGLVADAARSAAPYLLRQSRWNDLASVAEDLLLRSTGPAVAAVLLPMLDSALTVSRTPVERRRLQRVRARWLSLSDPVAGSALLDQVLRSAESAADWEQASMVIGDVIDSRLRIGAFPEALALCDTKVEYTRRAGYGPWTQVIDRGRRAQILYSLGAYDAVIDEVLELRRVMEGLPDPPGPEDSTVTTWAAWEITLNHGVIAATSRRSWQQALDLSADVMDSMRRRGASEVDRARFAFNEYRALVELDRAEDARDLLVWCRRVDEDTGDVESLGKTVGALAKVEHKLGHPDRALVLAGEALRYTYRVGDPDPIALAHSEMATYLASGAGSPEDVAAHMMASALINLRIAGGGLAAILQDLAELYARGRAPVPTDHNVVCTRVGTVDGVRLRELLDRLPNTTGGDESDVAAVCAMAQQLMPHLDTAGHGG